jgi:hypothetical protein
VGGGVRGGTFFETTARRGQIRCVHQRHGVGLDAVPMQQSFHQMLLDAPQTPDADRLPKLMAPPGGGPRAPQPGETPPRRLFRQLRHDQIEGMRGRQHGQQMGPPQLRGTQNVTASASEVARTNLGDEGIGRVRTQQFKQAAGANGRQSQTQDRTLTQTVTDNTPLVSA